MSHPDNYQNRSLAATACCCPCGVVALKHSLRVSYNTVSSPSTLLYSTLPPQSLTHDTHSCTITIQVNPRLRAGDVEGAKESSDQAVRYSYLSFLSGFFAYGIILLFIFCIILIGIFVAIDAARGLF